MSDLVVAISICMSPNRKKSKFVKSSFLIRFSRCEYNLTWEFGGRYQLTTIRGLDWGLRTSIQIFEIGYFKIVSNRKIDARFDIETNTTIAVTDSITSN